MSLLFRSSSWHLLSNCIFITCAKSNYGLLGCQRKRVRFGVDKKQVQNDDGLC